MQLSVIIVNYNGEVFLKDCIESIHTHCATISHEVILVDNNSQDNSLALLEKLSDPIKVIKNDENVGFSKANNIGVKASCGHNILLLNNDTILCGNITAAIDVLKDEKVGVVGIKMLGRNKEYRKSAGNFPSVWNLIKLSRMMKTNGSFSNGNFEEELYSVDWVEGSFLLTKRKYWDMVGGLSEEYFMYCEDVDFCKKINDKNLNTLFYSAISYIHFGGYTSARSKTINESFKKFVRKHITQPKRSFYLMLLKLKQVQRNVKIYF